LGALLAGADGQAQQRWHDFGLNLGYAFQIADDVLDYTADSGVLGKNLGDDLAEGKATLPLIHAMAHSDDSTRAYLRRIVEHCGTEQHDSSGLQQVQHALAATGALQYSRKRAAEFASAAEQMLEELPDNAAIAALRGLTRHAVARDY